MNQRRRHNSTFKIKEPKAIDYPARLAKARQKAKPRPVKDREHGYEWRKKRRPLGFSGKRKARKTKDGDRAKDVKDECDQLVRGIVRLRDCSCVTCNRGDRVLHVGHLFRRGLESVRWNLLNCNAQCDPCNSLHETAPVHYEMWFRFHYGNVAYDVLEITSRSKHKFTYIELLQIRDGLRDELARLEASQKARAA